MIGIIGALEEEVVMFKHDMDIKSSAIIAGCEFVLGTLSNRDVVITRCGMGKVNSASCTSIMIERYSPDIIINTGVGGSLDESLKVCDIMIAEDVVQHDYDIVSLGYDLAQVDRFDTPYFKCDALVNEAIKKSTDFLGYTSYFSRFATGDRFIDKPEDKEWISKTFGARVCDMETGSIAQICQLYGVRFSSIRTISDSTSGPDGAVQFQKFLKLASTHSVFVIEDILKSSWRFF
ncbi:MAG: 5'-methylthioadenosine/adenosylhomocysteine nucleosidase [Lachnospiraceae bacterium]|nr:5'-methylthioadenosine/adenosylhomocysteine nucleosidase [Lachnospiraceae bacterium]